MKPGRTNTQLGRWSLHERLGSGGNASVYRATGAGDEQAAVKVPERRWWTGSRYARFRDEIEGMRRCQDISGVIPLLEFNAPQAPNDLDPPWIAMGLAQPLEKALGLTPQLERVVEACAEIARVAAAMHERGISHRDIKPENLFKYQDRWAVGDLGLVDFDEKESLTVEGERLGPMFYIAPEMLNDARSADGRAADVYSLAKTLWKLATGQKFPIPGEMRRTVRALTVSGYLKHGRASLLDAPLEAATRFEPPARATMAEFLHELDSWLRPPTAQPVGTLELTDFASEIAGMNQRHYVEVERVEQEHTRKHEDGLRIRERFRPAVNEIVGAITRAGFINPIASIDNFMWGFDVGGYVMASAWLGEVGLRLQGVIQLYPNGKTDVRCSYVAQVHAESKTVDWELWQDSASFTAGGSSEEVAIGQLAASIRVQLRPCVNRIVGMAAGREGAPPRKP